MSMSLSSVWGVWMCVFLYIQNSEAAIRGFLPKNTDVEKTERAQENLWFNTPTKRGDLSVEQPLSLFRSVFDLWFHRPAGGAKAVKDESVLRVTNVTSLGEVRQKKKFGATNIRVFQSVVDGEWSVRETFFVPSRLTDVFNNRENKRSEFIFIITITDCHAFFWRKQDDKHRHRYNHALTKPPEREGDESALWTFDTLGLSRENI